MGVPITPAIQLSLIINPPTPKKKNPPKNQNKAIPSKTKTHSFDKTKSVTDSKPFLPLFFFLLLLLRLGHHLHDFNNSRAEVPSKTPATRKANYGRTKYQNLLDSSRGEERRVVNNIKF
jgi:hypothetical protein